MLRHLTPPHDPNLLSGFTGNSDAAVYRLTAELAIVQTVDYITPIVDDPEAFGAIAAANALSDIYAMGGRPVLALNLVGFPIKTLPVGILEAILRGGEAKLAEAGVTLGGGHSIEDLEPKYGLAVTGVVDPQRVITNAGARPGDILILTKPLGSGIITTGIDRGLVRRRCGRAGHGADGAAQPGGFRGHGGGGRERLHRCQRLRTAGTPARDGRRERGRRQDPCRASARPAGSLGPGPAGRDPGRLAQQRPLPGRLTWTGRRGSRPRRRPSCAMRRPRAGC